jgi:hypothetical protein
VNVTHSSGAAGSIDDCGRRLGDGLSLWLLRLLQEACDPGQIVLFAGSAVAVVAGVYVFFQALDASLSPRTAPVGMTNAVWASIGGLAVAFFTLDFILNEIRRIFTKPVEPTRIDPSDPQSPTSA